MEELLEVLSSSGIQIKAFNGQLEISDPNKKLDQNIIAILKEKKEELLEIFDITGKKVAGRRIMPQEDKEYYSLSGAQQRLYFIYRLDRFSTAYNVTRHYKIYGNLSVEKVNIAVRELIERHEILRTSIITVNDEPKQRINKKVDFNLSYHSISKDKDIGELLNSFRKPFELDKSPLFRLSIVEVARQNYILMLDMHHIITDGISSKMLVEDFVKLYNEETLDKVRICYKDFSEWQNSKKKQKHIKKQKEWWCDQFIEEVSHINLPTDYSRPKVMTYEGETINFSLSEVVSNDIKGIVKEEKTTLFAVLISIFNILLAKLSNTDDIVIGTPIAGRRTVDLAKTMGMFVNTLALRNFPKSNLTFLDFLNQVKHNVLQAFDNQDYQFEELINELNIVKDTGRHPLFDVMFVLTNVEEKELKIGELIVEPMISNHTNSKFDLTLECQNSGKELSFSLQYYKSVFKRETIERIIGYFKSIIQSICFDRNIRISEIDYIADSEKFKLISEYNKTSINWPVGKAIHQLFENQVEESPEHIALHFQGEHMTYADLNAKSNRLAWMLIQKGVGIGTIVGLNVRHSFEMIVGILGILKTGGCYLPIDTYSPIERKHFLIQESEMKLILTDTPDFKSEKNIEYINLKEERIYSEKNINPGKTVKSENPAYIIYTSGSTGRPKGVVVSHSSLVNYINWAGNVYNEGSNLNFPLYSSISFDLTVTSLFTPIVNGAAIYIYDTQSKEFTIDSILEENNLGVMKLTPAHLQILTEEKLNESNIKVFIVGGEELSTGLASKVNSNISVYNEYGPTEATVGCMIYKYNPDTDKGQSVPIGIAAGNQEVYILDSKQMIVPVGVVGELCIGGNGLALGYLNNLELTSSKFIDHPFKEGEKLYRTGDLTRWLANGNMEFIGRVDDQVKIRGFRVELGEIQKVLSRFKYVNDSLVIAKKEVSNTILVGYYTSGIEIDRNEVRNYMLKKLPNYMVPSFFMRVDEIPLTQNGKIDYRRLPKYDLKNNSDYVGPRNEMEKNVVEIWEDVLDVKGYKVSVYDNFFELGGNSISLLTLNSKIRKKFDIELSISDLMVSPTINDIMTYLKKPIDSSEQMEIKAQKAIDVKSKTLGLLSKLKN